MKEETLRVKALRCACRQLDNTWTREAAKLAYADWKVFWDEPEYKEAVKRLQIKLKENERI